MSQVTRETVPLVSSGLSNTSSSKPIQVPNVYKFMFGGIAGMGATCVVQPLDLIKNRMQLLGSDPANIGKRISTVSVASQVIRNEGFFSLYNGLSAGLLRQASYTTVRMGVYNSLIEKFQVDGKTPFITQLACGMTSGAAGAFVGTPAEVSLIRMTADGRLPPDQRRNYSNVFNALARIVREEGVKALWTGSWPTIGRSVIVNGCQLSSYSQAKQRLLATGYFSENIMLHFVASMISGLLTTAVSMPVDIAKTRLQNMKKVAGKAEYTSTIDVLVKVTKNEGFFCLWKGFTPYYARLGPHTVLTFIILEQLNAIYKTKMSEQ